jgi:CheY-like chemotaxis protein
VLKFYLAPTIQLRFHLLTNDGTFFLFSVFEDIEEKILVGDLNNKLAYSYMLICSLSHELYTPINHLLNSSDVLLSLCSSTDKKAREMREEAQLLQSTSQCLLIFVQNMLDFARYINKTLQMQTSHFKLKEVVLSTVDLFRIKAKRKRLKLEVLCPDYVLNSDFTKIQGLLQIFLDNAIKFTQSGGVSIKIGIGRTSEMIRFEIIDTGIGIDEEDLIKLADIMENPFSDIRTNGSAGIGIGFRVAQILLMYLSGGDSVVDFKSVRGQGTSITFEIRKDPKPIDNETLHTLQKSVTCSMPHQEKSKQFGVDRALLNVGNNMKKRFYSDDSFDKKKIVLSEGMEENLEGIDLAKTPAKKDLESSVHNVPRTHNSPQLIGSINRNRARKLVTATVCVKAIAQKNGSKMNTVHTEDFVGLSFPKVMKPDLVSSDDVDLEQLNLSMESKKVALVVDDDIFNAEFMQSFLEEFGFEVYISYDGELAIELCMKFLTWNKHIDIIFMDYSMANMNGDVCTRKLKASKFDSILDGTIIVGVTAHRDEKIKQRCLRYDMDSVEFKPFNKDKMQEILEKYRLLRTELDSSKKSRQEYIFEEKYI